MRFPKVRIKLNLLVCEGGPWDGQRVGIPVRGTLVFRVGEFHGRYDAYGEWENV